MFRSEDYWPWPKKDELFVIDHRIAKDGPLIFQSLCSHDPSCDGCVIDQYDFTSGTSKWVDKWYMKVDPIQGVLEWKDDFPAKNIQKIMGPVMTLTYLPNKSIIWGKEFSIGDAISGPFQIDHCRSNKLPPFTGSWSYGTQIVKFDDHFPTYTNSIGIDYQDVIKLTYVQTINNSTIGSIFWMAKGMGFIDIQFIVVDSTSLKPTFSGMVGGAFRRVA